MEFTRCFGCMEEKKNHPVCEHCGFDERTPNAPHQLPVGTILQGHYLVGRVLGQGGFGITYLGWDMYLDMPVAIKEYYPSGIVTRDASVSTRVTGYTGAAGGDYEANKVRFMQEGKALAKLESLHNIVRIYALFPENNTVYLVMEYARGITLLKSMQQKKSMTLGEILQILDPIMDDLQKVHEKNLIHRDISPDNIMLLSEGGAKLLDFGAVRLVENPSQDGSLTRPTQAILKQGFAPLEQYNSQGALGPWTDVYALCATICYCLSGRVPTQAPDRVLESDPDRFIRALPVTEMQKRVLCQGMAIKPRDRIPTVAALKQALHQSLQEGPLPYYTPPLQPEPPVPLKPVLPPQPPVRPVTPKPPVSPAKSKRRKNTPWVSILSIALAAMAAIGLVIQIFKPDRPPEPERAAVTQAAATEETRADLKLVIPYSEDLELMHSDTVGDSEFIFGTLHRKCTVRSIDFRDSLEGAPDFAVDVSRNGSRRVLMWAEEDSQGLRLVHIAGDGKVFLPKNSTYLFGGSGSSEKEDRFSALEQIDFNGAVDTSQVENMFSMFGGCSSLRSVDFSEFDTHGVQWMGFLFNDCTSLTSVDLTGLDTGKVKSYCAMFLDCTGLQSLDVSCLDFSACEDTSWMFKGCSGLRQLRLGDPDTSQVTDMDSMFEDCSSLEKLDVSGLDTQNVTDMRGMFNNAAALTHLDLSTMDTGNVTNMSYMFYDCASLIYLNLTSFDLSSAEKMDNMFLDCNPGLEIHVSPANRAQISAQAEKDDR